MVFHRELPGACLLAACLLALASLSAPFAAEPTPAARPPLPRSEVKEHGGAPTLFIDGKPQSGLSYMTYRPTPKHFRQLGQAGIHLYSFSATPTEAGYGLAPACWVAPEKFDFSGMDGRAAMVLEADPAAFFFPRLYLNSPSWWDALHPDDLVTYDPGDGKPVPFFHGGNVAAGKRVASWASKAWREDTAGALREFIRHVEASPYGHRVIGYHLASGTTEEWMQWGSNEDQWVDYSPASVAAFRRWLEARYGSEDKLRAAWGDPQASFQAVQIPSRAERSGRELGLFRDPAKAGRAIDYVLYNSWLVADTVRYLAAAVKEATDRRALVGVFYGYVLQLAGEQREQNAGHLALADVLRCPDIDFLTSPTSYAFRQLGTGFSHFMSLTDSVKLHGKLWFDENDIRTWLTREGNVGDWGKTATFEESLLCQERELGNVLAQGCGMWWFDMSAGWYDDPRMLSAIERMGKIGEESLRWDRAPAAEVAFVVDDRSLAYLAIPCPASRQLLMDQLPVLGRIGAPFATIHLADMEKAGPYKLLIFPNVAAPSEQEREAILRAASRPGCVAVFQLAPGVIRGGAVDEKAMEALAGIRLRFLETPRPAKDVWIREANPWTEGLPREPSGRPYSLCAVSDDPGATVLARAPDGSPTVVLKKRETSTLVFSPGPIGEPAFLRNLARAAGVHLYTEAGDVVWASKSILTVSVGEGGPRRIELPGPASVTEILAGRHVGKDLKSFTHDFPPRSTAIFHLDRAGASPAPLLRSPSR